MKEEQKDSGMQQSDDIRSVIRNVIQEYISVEKQKAEPAYKTELLEEKRRREQLERRVNELVHENQRSKAVAEEAERQSVIRAELQRQGVTKLDLAFRAVRDDIRRGEDGSLVAVSANGEMNLREYISRFVDENPEFLPARIVGGSGAANAQRGAGPPPPAPVDLEKIRPGMDEEDLQRIRQEVARVALQTLSGK